MTAVEELARGVIVAGFDGTHLPERLPQFAGYVLFARNGTAVESVRAITDALRAAYAGAHAPILAVDQEGGRVARLQEGAATIPPMMALGAARSTDLAERAGRQTAFDLRRAGCTLDFAPVLDLSLDPRSTVIGTRSFGADPAAVAELGAAFARGLEEGGAIACPKHFPGHGATAVDSHLELPVIAASAATLRVRDLVPFAAVVPHVRAMMGAHVLVRAFDEEHPATRSPRIATGLLRGELGFRGAYVTDCLHMQAIAAESGTVTAALAALAAGADLLLISHSIDLASETAERIERAVKSGGIPLERLVTAYERVLRLRRAGQTPLALDAPAPHAGVGREIAREAVTLLRGASRADPGAAFAISFEGSTSEGAQGAHAVHPSLRREAPALLQIELPLEPGEAEVDAALAHLARSGRRALVLSRRAHLHAAQRAAIERIVAQDPDAALVSMREPYDTAGFANARHLLAAYGDDAASVGGLADVLFGGSPARGVLPVSVTDGA